MTAAPQGWYPDPGGSPDQRWWDGQQWTGYTYPSPAPTQPTAWASAPTLPETQSAQAPPVPASTETIARFDTPYATFWQRVAAYIVDVLLLAIPTALIFIPLVGPELLDWIEEFTNAIEANGENLDIPSATALIARTLVAGVLAAIVSGAYFVILIAKRGATVGMSLLRIHVVTEQSDRPSWGRSLARWGVVQGIALAGNAVPIVGGLLPLLDNLWMLWDEENQTLHDKAVSTWVLQRPDAEA